MQIVVGTDDELQSEVNDNMTVVEGKRWKRTKKYSGECCFWWERLRFW